LAICDLCTKEKPDEGFEFLDLTPQERVYLRASGVNRERLSFCKGCWGAITKDREQGARLLQGLFQTGLREMGAATSEKNSAKMFDVLMGKK